MEGIYYLVLSKPNARETSNVEGPCLLTPDPDAALKRARDLRDDPHVDFISAIWIFEVEEGKMYTPKDFLSGSERDKHLVFLSWKYSEGRGWGEEFHGSFVERYGGERAQNKP